MKANRLHAEILAGEEYFSDSLPDLQHEKDAMQHLRGMWLLEIGEMAAMSRSDADQIKHFVSKTSDRFRPSYGRNEVTNHRQCVFVGTTNRDDYLRDETGARRFWPVTVGTVDLDALKYDRDQLFAEAVVAFKAGEHWWPSRDFEREHMAAQQEMRQEGDPWEPVIANYVEDQDRVTTLEIARLGIADPDRAAWNRSAASDWRLHDPAGLVAPQIQWQPLFRAPQEAAGVVMVSTPIFVSAHAKGRTKGRIKGHTFRQCVPAQTSVFVALFAKKGRRVALFGGNGMQFAEASLNDTG